MTNVLVIGAGPAGLSAALELRRCGLSVTVTDDQPTPGGRIFANIEGRQADGTEDRGGADLVKRFRASGGEYLSGAEVWQIEQGPRVFLTQGGAARVIEPQFLLLATGAHERPMPFPGWELPGVITVGGAQTLLKTSGQIPDAPVWLAGSGPLLLLYVRQLLAKGGKVAGILDTGRSVGAAKTAGLLAGALAWGWRDLLRGLGWLASNRGLRIVRGVVGLEAKGDGRLQTLSWTTDRDVRGEARTEMLLIHDGVIPSVHAAMAAGCEHRWNEEQRCFEPLLDAFRGTTVPQIFVAGDGGGIQGGRAAVISGKLAALGIARAAGAISDEDAKSAAAPLRSALAAASRFRSLVDRLYPPVELAMPDATLVCRCEEVTAGTLRRFLAKRRHAGPDGAKIATRIGMGPCQGRQCGLSLSRLVAEVHNVAPAEVGLLRVRPPFKPLTLDELASLESA